MGYYYIQELADMLGVNPEYEKIFQRSPKLANQVQYGPVVNVRYRLVGPGSCEWAWKEHNRACRRILKGSKLENKYPDELEQGD